jgi:hypothetical protein
MEVGVRTQGLHSRVPPIEMNKPQTASILAHLPRLLQRVCPTFLGPST